MEPMSNYYNAFAMSPVPSPSPDAVAASDVAAVKRLAHLHRAFLRDSHTGIRSPGRSWVLLVAGSVVILYRWTTG